MVTVVRSCAAVQATTLWNVLITPVVPMKSVGRVMEDQAAILKVRCLLNVKAEGVDSNWFPSFQTSAITSVTIWPLTRVCPLSLLPADTSTCVASGDPHYTTFDKRRYNFMGNCSYVMSKPCNHTSSPPYFEVHADNENRFNKPKVSYLKAVHVYVYDVKISILKGGTVQVRHWQTYSQMLSFGRRCGWCSRETFLLMCEPAFGDLCNNLVFYLTGEWDQREAAHDCGPWCLCVKEGKALHCGDGLWCDRSLWWKPLHGHQSYQRVSERLKWWS